MTVSTDAFLLGWEAILPGTTIGGRWVPEEAQVEAHINLLELKAAYLELSALFKSSTPVARGSIYEQERGDTITCIVDTSHRPMGSSLSGFLGYSRTYPGTSNEIADTASRHFNNHSEWML